MQIYVDLKKELIVHWCFHFKIEQHILLSFFVMLCSFITYAKVNYDGLSYKM